MRTRAAHTGCSFFYVFFDSKDKIYIFGEIYQAMKRILLSLIFIGSLFFALSCDKNESGDNSMTKPGEYSELSPSKHQAKLDDIGAEFISYFDVNEYRDAIRSIEDFIEYLESFSFEGSPYAAAAESISKGAEVLLNSVETKNPAVMFGMVPYAAYTYSIFEALGGTNGIVFTYSKRSDSWRENETDDYCIVFEYDDAVIEMEYSPSSTLYKWEFDGERFAVEIPSTITVNFTVDSELQFSLEIKPNLSQDNLSASPKITLVLGSLEFNALAVADQSKLLMETSIESGSKEIMSAYAKVAVKGMTDPDNWVYEDEWGEYIDPSEYFVENAVSGEFSLQILTAKLAGAGNIRKVMDEIDYLEESMDYWDDEEYYESLADIVNEHVKMFLMYTDEKQTIADVMLDTCYYDGDMSVEPILVFGDGSRVAVESYFSNSSRFSDTIEAFEKLYDDLNMYFEFE